MIHLSQYQLIRLWSQLEQAYYKDNRYGKDTAKIYAYTLLEHHPSLVFKEAEEDTLLREMQDDRSKQAATTLIEVLRLFQKMRGCKVLIDGLSITTWRKKYQGFSYTVKVTVEH